MCAYAVHVQAVHYAYVPHSRTQKDKHIHSRAQASYISTARDIYMRNHVHYRHIFEQTFITACIHYTHTHMNAWTYADMTTRIHAHMRRCMCTPVHAYKQPWQFWPSKPWFSWSTYSTHLDVRNKHTIESGRCTIQTRRLRSRLLMQMAKWSDERTHRDIKY